MIHCLCVCVELQVSWTKPPHGCWKMQRACPADAEPTRSPAATRLLLYLEWKWRPRAYASASSMTAWTVTSLWQSLPSHVRMTTCCDTSYVKYTVGRKFFSSFSLPLQVFMFFRGLGLCRKERLVSLCLEIITTENSQVRFQSHPESQYLLKSFTAIQIIYLSFILMI